MPVPTGNEICACVAAGDGAYSSVREGVDAILRVLCDKLGGAGGGSSYTAGEAVAASSVVSDASSITAGKAYIKVKNVGAALATFLGENLYPNEELEFSAFLDPVNSIYNLLPAMAYDATNSDIRITTLTPDTP